MTYEVQTYTICQGWINCWIVDNQPQSFKTYAEAQAELDAYFDDLAAEIVAGERLANEGYDREDYRIVKIGGAAGTSSTAQFEFN